MRFSFENTSPAYQPFPYNTQEQKKEILTLVERYRKRLEAQWDDVKDDTLHYGKHALVIGGVVTGVYLIMEALLPDAKEDTNTSLPPAADKKSSSSSFGSALQGMALTMALTWARTRLTNFLEAEHHTHAQNEL
ncbi:hypothetical protein [Telluribacter sp.]|jgi:hypothetical protein|uniref:hypothetical protein n=1 Tax=Telluribacter sp. TaxID=1978767 RepID=UPI002E1031F2|nr:hypothetical protein [Telluribacter sp.]